MSNLRATRQPLTALLRLSRLSARQQLHFQPLACRLISSSSKNFEYPKEGVFQPNSPPRHVPGFGPPPPSPHEQPPLSQLNLEHGQPQPQRRGWKGFWSFLKYTGYFVAFASGFFVMQLSMAGTVPLEQGTVEDEEELELLFDELEELPIVQQLRTQRKVVDGRPGHLAWQEWRAYQGFSKETKDQRLTTGPLGGSAGVAAQKCFYDEAGKQLCLFINFGPATQGWPQVVHGGAITTIFDEALGRVAIRATEEKTAVTANLDVNFKQPVPPGQWLLLYAELDVNEAGESMSTDKKKYVKGFLACCNNQVPFFFDDGTTGAVQGLEGVHVHAEAHGLFVVPKTTKLNQIPDKF